MTFSQKTFPEEIRISAKNLENGYFIEHLTQTDYFSKGYEAIPSLFRFCFDKTIYMASLDSVEENLEKIESEINSVEDKILEIINSTTFNEEEKNYEKKAAEEIIVDLKDKKDSIEKLVAFKKSDYTDFDLSTTMKGIAAFIYNESKHSKPVNAFIYKFFDHNIEKTNDFIQFYSERSIGDFIQVMMSKGFVYDKENCLFGKVVDAVGFVEDEISEDYKNKLILIDNIAAFVRANNYFEYLDFVEEHKPNIDDLFDVQTLAAYAIAMDKQDFALREISSKNDSTLTKTGELNDLVTQSMYSIIYRNHKFSDYLSTIIGQIDFTNKSQEYIDKFVVVTFEELKKSLSKEVFESYKSKIDIKKLSLALIKDCNVYRLENTAMSKLIDDAFDNYQDDILKTENIISHFQYYAMTMQMLENLSKVPDIVIGGIPAAEHVSSYMQSVIAKIDKIKENNEVKYDFWENDSELRTEEEFLKFKAEKIKSYFDIFGIESVKSF
jgi:hypothetical protein